MLSETAQKILDRKYLRKDSKGNVAEDYESMCARVAYHVAKGEKDSAHWTNVYFNLMLSQMFLPGGRVLANAGTNNTNLFNCYLLGIEDSRESIYKTLTEAAEIFAHGGGVGFNFSKLREEGTPVSNGSHASGPVSFLTLFDTSASVISQASRRGAQMAVLNCDHPDIFKFIQAKNTEYKLNHFNVSVGITDEFMQCLLKKVPFKLRSRYSGEVVREVDPNEILQAIANNMWKTGEPGILFLDRLESGNSVPHLGKLDGTNPCAEVPLLPGEACCLGSINLVKMLTTQKGKKVFDKDLFVEIVSYAIRFLDSVHDSHIPVSNTSTSARTRKLGLGVMGWADVLLLLGIPYDSEEAFSFAEELSSVMKRTAYETSVYLAEEKGAYPAFDPENSRNIWYPEEELKPTRNATLLCIAPTGSISLVCDVNTSIEPFYALYYTKNVTEGEDKTQYKIVELNKYLSAELDRENLRLLKEIKENPNLISEIVDSRYKTAHDISPESHIRMQAQWQKNVDGSISKTINLPNEATVDEISTLIFTAWIRGLKGFTIYRDGCRDFQVLNSG